MTDLETLVSDVLDRATEMGDPTGVADAIRSRAAVGEIGAPTESSVAPGWGAGIASWLPWIGVVALAGVAGGALGVSGAFGSASDPDVGILLTGPVTSAPLLACPGGPVVRTVDAGTRALAVARSEEGDYLAIRNPNSLADLVWLETESLILDADQPGIGTLPFGEECPEVTIVAATPTPAPGPVPAPDPGPDPAPDPGPSDTTDPIIIGATASPNPVYALEPVTVQLTATDDVAVTCVQISWSGQFTGSSTMTKVGSAWLFTFTPTENESGTVDFTMQARDAAGNLSHTTIVAVQHLKFG